jgi:serine/threonine protein kinase
MLSGNHQVAVKVPKCFRNDLSGPMTLANEIRLYRRIRHPNIVLCYGVTIMNLPSPLPCLVLDWVDGGNLSTFVTARRANGEFQRESKEVFSDEQARHDLSNLKYLKETKLLIDVAWGMQYLHAQKPAILHMDLKPQNILIQDADGQPSAQITDFGLSMLLDHDILKSNVGTIRYMAPEVQQNRKYHKPAEVYSFGLTVAFAISGQHPAKSKKADVISVLHKQMLQLLQVPHLPRRLVKICTKCLSPKPSSRPSFAELCILLAQSGSNSASADGGSQNPGCRTGGAESGSRIPLPQTNL